MSKLVSVTLGVALVLGAVTAAALSSFATPLPAVQKPAEGPFPPPPPIPLGSPPIAASSSARPFLTALPEAKPAEGPFPPPPPPPLGLPPIISFGVRSEGTAQLG